MDQSIDEQESKHRRMVDHLIYTAVRSNMIFANMANEVIAAKLVHAATIEDMEEVA